MRQLPPHSRIFLATDPVAFRQGIDGRAAGGRQRLGDTPLAGAVSVCRHRSGPARTRLLSDGHGYGMRRKRLSQGRCAWWPNSADARGPLSARARIILPWNGTPDRAQLAQDWRRGASGEARLLTEAPGSHAAGFEHPSCRGAGSTTRDSTALTPPERHVAIRLGSTLAREALGGLWSNRACLRCRLNRCKARSATWLSRGAPVIAKNRVNGCQGVCRSPMAVPSARLGATQWASLCWSSHHVRAAIRGWRCAWW